MRFLFRFIPLFLSAILLVAPTVYALAIPVDDFRIIEGGVFGDLASVALVTATVGGVNITGSNTNLSVGGYGSTFLFPRNPADPELHEGGLLGSQKKLS